MQEITAKQGKITLDENFIKQSFLDNSITPVIIMLAFMFLINFLFNTQTHVMIQSSKSLTFLSGLFVLVLLAFVIQRMLFLCHKRTIDLNRIVAIRIRLEKEGMETHLDVTLPAKRHKHYFFRTLENQHGILIDYICSTNPAVKVIRIKEPV